MLIIPVIDIKDGKCVRTIEGHGTVSNFYSESPVKTAKLFRKENFKAIHITNLDASIHGEFRNLEIIKEIVNTVDIPVQIGGGIRNFKNAEIALKELGVFRIVLGTAAITQPDLVTRIISEFSASKVVIGIDEKLNNVVAEGWINYINVTPIDFALRMQDLGVKRIIYQDVTRVGNLCGAHIARLIELAEKTELKITSAGGICDYKDLKALIDLNKPQIDSAIVSRALFENKFPCQKLWRDIEKEDTSLELPEV